MPTDTSTKLTYEDYLLIPEDGLRHELIDGEHHVTPAPLLRHQIVVANVGYWLSAFVRRARCGLVLFAPFDVVLSPNDIVQPDVIYLSNERRRLAQDRGLFGPPDLAVEMLSESTSRRDRVIKRERYDLFGVTEYWIVDPTAETLHIERRGSTGRFETAAKLSKADIVTTPLLPGFELAIGDVFSE